MTCLFDNLFSLLVFKVCYDFPHFRCINEFANHVCRLRNHNILVFGYCVKTVSLKPQPKQPPNSPKTAPKTVPKQPRNSSKIAPETVPKQPRKCPEIAR